MRRVVRTAVPPPAALTATGRDGTTELERARAHYRPAATAAPSRAGRRAAAFAFRAYRDPTVKEALERLFHGKCAYCETCYSAACPVDVEHFRPKSAVREDPSHPGYWWLAASWENLLPSCIDCNRSRQQTVVGSGHGRRRDMQALAGKGSAFPLQPGSQRLLPEAVPDGGERPLLLNPCQDDPAQHLQFLAATAVAGSLAAPRHASPRGAASIAIFGLNRLGLVQERTRQLRRLQLLGDQVLRLARLADRHGDPELDALLRDTMAAMVAMAAPDQPYSAMAAAWLDEFTAAL